MNTEHERGFYVTVLAFTRRGEGTVCFVNRVSATEYRNICKGAVDVEPLRYNFFFSVRVAGITARGPCVILVVLDSNLGMSMIREKKKWCIS